MLFSPGCTRIADSGECNPLPDLPKSPSPYPPEGYNLPRRFLMPNYDLGLLITLDIGLALIGLIFSGLIYLSITRHLTRATTEIAEMHREVAFMIRRQYGDIDRDLQEIKELLGGGR
jgi:hypothetical protein